MQILTLFTLLFKNLKFPLPTTTVCEQSSFLNPLQDSLRVHTKIVWRSPTSISVCCSVISFSISTAILNIVPTEFEIVYRNRTEIVDSQRIIGEDRPDSVRQRLGLLPFPPYLPVLPMVYHYYHKYRNWRQHNLPCVYRVILQQGGSPSIPCIPCTTICSATLLAFFWKWLLLH